MDCEVGTKRSIASLHSDQQYDGRAGPSILPSPLASTRASEKDLTDCTGEPPNKKAAVNGEVAVTDVESSVRKRCDLDLGHWLAEARQGSWMDSMEGVEDSTRFKDEQRDYPPTPLSLQSAHMARTMTTSSAGYASQHDDNPLFYAPARPDSPGEYLGVAGCGTKAVGHGRGTGYFESQDEEA